MGEAWIHIAFRLLEWYEAHVEECTANHEGSSGKMEVDDVIEMFQRSVQWLGVKYKKYIGNGARVEKFHGSLLSDLAQVWHCPDWLVWKFWSGSPLTLVSIL